MHPEARRQGASFGCEQVLIEDGGGVGIEVLLHQHDFLGPG